MASNVDRMQIKPETLGHALKDHQLHVPRHQRSYAWEKEHILDLFQDLAYAISSHESEHFLGSIVVVSNAGKLEVNDGQQRLATTAILIAAIRDYFMDEGDEEAAGKIEREFLLKEKRRSQESPPKLYLNNIDHTFFYANILSRLTKHQRKKMWKERASTKTESHRRLSVASELASQHIAQVVSTLPPSARLNALDDWLNFLETKARVIWVEVGDARTAYFLFETMNDRGLKLSAADLLKNLLLALAGGREDEAFAKWNAMTGVIDSLGAGSDGIVDYIRYLWISMYGPIRERALYDKIKSTIRTEAHALAFVATLETRSIDYAALLSSSHPKWAQYSPSVRKQIETLNSLGIKQNRPLLLAAMAKFSKRELEKLFFAAVSWSVRYLISGTTPGAIEGPHGKNAEEVWQGKLQTTEALALSMGSIIPDDSRFKAAVANASVSQARLARYYLSALQWTADGKPEPQYVVNEQQDSVTLEHVLPENPGTKWSHIPDEIAKSLYTKLGNQVLLGATVNHQIGNASYEDKKAALKDSAFSLTKRAAEFQIWNADVIAVRQKELAEIAVKTWPLKKAIPNKPKKEKRYRQR